MTEQLSKKTVAELEALVSSLLLENNRLRHDSIHDRLTGLQTYEFFLNSVDHYFFGRGLEEKRRERTGRRISVLFCDFDYFKQLNDEVGHDLGDQALVAAAKAIKGSTRLYQDVACRRSGDEFIIALIDLPKEKSASKYEEIKQAIDRALLAVIGDRKLSHQPSVSIGVVELDAVRGDLSLEEVIKLAEEEMYKSKASGRGQINVKII